jgi:hypothetical protein
MKLLKNILTNALAGCSRAFLPLPAGAGNRSPLLVFCAALIFFAASAFAQPLGDTLYTVGTTTTNSLTSQRTAVVLWQPIPSTLVAGKKFAVYAKPGDANSASPFVRRSVTGLTTDPLVLAPLLNRAAGLGDNLATFDEHLANLFAALVPSNNVTRAERLAVVIAGAQSDARNLDSLAALGRVHLGLNFCLGRAYAEPVTNTTTFEVREFDAASGKDLLVVGRVTIDPAAPTALPAPGAPIALPETGSFGHLNAKLRWAAPDNLRRLSLLQYGFNVYCVPRAAAEANGWHIAPPAPAQLRALPATRQVNFNAEGGALPVMATKLFSTNDVENFALDAKTHFVADDNNGTRGGAGFHDGEQVYYFLTACDVLGRDGAVSPGTLVTLCAKVPPNPPRGLRVDNDFPNTPGGQQRLKIHWQVAPTSTNSAWFVYRWTDSKAIAAFGNNPSNSLIAGPLTASNGVAELAYRDDGAGAPGVATDAGKTFWFTVREAENTACGWNYSPHSAPAFGVLRDRTGPDAPVGGVNFRCCAPQVFSDNFSLYQATDAQTAHSTNEVWFRLIVRRQSPAFQWADFSYSFYSVNTEANGVKFGRLQFGNANAVTNWLHLPAAYFSGWETNAISLTFTVTAGGAALATEATTYLNEYVDMAQASPASAFAADLTASLNCGDAETSAATGCLIVQSYGGSIMPLDPPASAPVNYSFFGYDPYHAAQWVDVYLNNANSPSNRLARLKPNQFGTFTLVFPTNENIFTSPYLQPQFLLRAGGNGTVSDLAFPYLYQRPTGSNEILQVNFFINTNCSLDFGGGGDIGHSPGRVNLCTRHTPTEPGATNGIIQPIKTWFWLSDGAQEWRVYRRVDDGPLQLIKQGLASYADTLTVTNADAALPANSGTVCYFAQQLDEHGNPSPLAPLGCVTVAPVTPAPAPMLAPLEAAGDALNPQMKISWFCPPAGVDRFEVCIAAEGQSPAPNVGGTVTPDNFSLSNPQSVALADGTSVVENFGFYRTPKASVLGGGAAQFTRTVNVQANVKYFVFIRSQLNGGDFSPFSNVGEFTFHPPPLVPPPGVAWPQRPLPGYNLNLAQVTVFPLLAPTLNTNTALYITNVDFPGFGLDIIFPVSGIRWIPGVKIGEVALPSEGIKIPVAAFSANYSLGPLTIGFGWSVNNVFELGVTNPLVSITKDANGKSLLPAVLYRTQIPNTFFPRVSGDLIQVTPQMSGVAHTAHPGSPENCFVTDPFVYPYEAHAFATSNNVTSDLFFRGLFLVDTQPRLIAATYAYLLVRFNEYGEVRDVLPCGTYTEPVQ